MTATPTQKAPAGSREGLPAGATRWSHVYFDETGRQCRAREMVPVDLYGALAAKPMHCRTCKGVRWFSATLKGAPVCELHNRRMEPKTIQPPPLLPWREIRDVIEPYLRPVWPFAAAVPVASAAYQHHIPWLGVAAAGVVAAEIARRGANTWLSRKRSGVSKRTRSKRARAVAYGTLAGSQWLALAAATGINPHTAGGVTALSLWPLVTAATAAPWWRYHTQQRNRPAPAPVIETVPEEPWMDPLEKKTRHVWASIVAGEKDKTLIGKGAPTDKHPNGAPVFASRDGKLAGTILKDWHRVEGGWAATAVGPPGVYTSENFLNARGAIASAFSMKAHMVSIIPDGDDENQALISTQRTTAITNTVRWSGPDSIDVNRWRASLAQYKDGGIAEYEVFRPGWGTPHDFLCGTTGSGKSETLCLLLTIDRWVNHNGKGLVADLLIDPQQGQSYGPFLDDLAAPVACTLEEATLLVKAVQREMYRRNRYLARSEWPDPRRRKPDGSPVMRKGRKWWDPLVDGPIITLNIDEAHAYLADRAFAQLVTSGARMYRKCGIRIRVATHTPLLTDLGGSMALRDMLTGGFVWVGRTANSLSGPTAFNGRLPVDPRTIPDVPGMAYILSAVAPLPMLARSMWEPDFYDHIRDYNDEPIGYPAALPPETLAAFGDEYASWVKHASDPEAGPWTPQAAQAATGSGKAGKGEQGDARCADVVLTQITAAKQPLSMDDLDATIRHAGHSFSTRTIRDALKKLRESGHVTSSDGMHSLASEGALF